MHPVISAALVFTVSVYGLSTTSWALTQFSYWYCAPPTVWGFVSMPLTMGSPVCQIINFTQYELGQHYIKLWIGAGASLVAFMSGII